MYAAFGCASLIPLSRIGDTTDGKGHRVGSVRLCVRWTGFGQFELGPMDVQVFGNVAAAHGSVTEERIRDGKDTSGEFVWMDLLEKRGGKWVIVRSAGARVK